MEGFLDTACLSVGRVSWRFGAVMRVLTTQIGFVINTVSEPAIAPAVMDSTVVNFLDARPALTAAASKKDLDHSYPE